jgi:adiponectin receptor
LYYVIRPRHEFATLSDVLVFACFIGGAGLCLGMSATFHAVLNHSQKVARWGNKLDYTGIIVLIVGSFVPALYYGFFCMPTLLTAYLCLVSFALRGRDLTVNGH